MTEDWLTWRAALPLTAANFHEPLLLDNHEQRYNRGRLSQLMARIGLQAGIPFRMSAHKLRHTVNVRAKRAGVDPYDRSRLLNHSSVRSLESYEHLMDDELVAARQRTTDAMQAELHGDTAMVCDHAALRLLPGGSVGCACGQVVLHLAKTDGGATKG